MACNTEVGKQRDLTTEEKGREGGENDLAQNGKEQGGPPRRAASHGRGAGISPEPSRPYGGKGVWVRRWGVEEQAGR